MRSAPRAAHNGIGNDTPADALCEDDGGACQRSAAHSSPFQPLAALTALAQPRGRARLEALERGCLEDARASPGAGGWLAAILAASTTSSLSSSWSGIGARSSSTRGTRPYDRAAPSGVPARAATSKSATATRLGASAAAAPMAVWNMGPFTQSERPARPLVAIRIV